MSLLKDLYTITEAKEDLSKLPEDVVSEIRSNITKGAKDLQQIWANALELVQKAYEVSGVQRPTPDMRDAWTQYEENLQYAVEQLGKHRGMDADWRMSSSVFREALERKHKFRVTELGDDFGKAHTIHAKSLDDVLNIIKDKNSSKYQTKIIYSEDSDPPSTATITFSQWGVANKKYRVKIEHI